MKADFEEGRLIDVIQEAVKPEIIKVEGEEFVSREVHHPPRRKLVDVLVVASLTGIADYLSKGVDTAARKGTFIHVVHPQVVSVFNDIGEDTDRRFEAMRANAAPPKATLNTYLAKEDAMIALQALFVDTEERNALLQQLGTLVANEELQQKDDGVTQSVMTQKGVNRGYSDIKNPVKLRPFRTFAEIEQPESPFIVRIRKEEGEDTIEVGLFEADGGAWQNEARLSIKKFLEENLQGGSVPILA